MFQPYIVIIRLATRDKISTQLHLGWKPKCFTNVLYQIYSYQVGYPWDEDGESFKALLTAFLFGRKTVSSDNTHNEGQLQQTFHSCPLEKAYDLSILNTLTPEIKLLLYSLPNLLQLMKTFKPFTSLFPRLSNFLMLYSLRNDKPT